ncbi:MAG: cytochrome c3 family protein [Bacillota bacterium]
MGRLKPCLISLLALLFFTALAVPAFAWTHGQFSATTDACAGCHIAHAAEAPKLLKAGPTQAQFCFLCHGDGCSSAPYDVKDGETRAVVGGGVYASTAGGFVNEFIDANSNYQVDAGEIKPVTSRHSVWGLPGETGGVIGNDNRDDHLFIPGGTNQFAGGSGFACASCHDPHAGGRTPNDGYVTGTAGSSNPRLLRKSITIQDGANTNLYVSFRMQTVGTFSYTPGAGIPVDSGVYTVIGYTYGSTKWCGACHNKFKTANWDFRPGQGHANFYLSMWRHPMDAHVLPPPGFDGSIATGTPVEEYESDFGVKRLACLTCHRAHSTIADADGWASSWPRDLGAPTPASNTSALLRMENRGVCFNCHGAGQYNCWNDNRLVLAEDGVSYIPMDCSNCHPSTEWHFTVGGGGYDCSVCHN